MEVKEENERAGLKLNIQNIKIMASGPITSWQTEGERVENSGTVYFPGLQNHWGQWLQSRNLKTLVLRRTAVTNLDSTLKSKGITLPTNVSIGKAMVFPVVMYGCKSWTIQKADTEEPMPSNYGAGEDSWEFLGLQGDQTSDSWRKSTLNIHWRDWCWSWSSNALATWCKELTHLKRP